MREDGIAIAIVGVAINGQGIELELSERAAAVAQRQPGNNHAVGGDGAGDGFFTSAMNELDAIRHTGLHRDAVKDHVEASVAGLGVFQRSIDGSRIEITPVCEGAEVIELKQIGGRTVRSRKTGVGGIGKMQQADGELIAVVENRHVAQLQIKLDAEAIIRREGHAEWMIKKTVGLGGIPGDSEHVVG